MIYVLLSILSLFFLVAVYAPFIAAGDPIWIVYQGEHYFPLLRHLFLHEYFSKPIDLFFNVAIFTLPIFLILSLLPRSTRRFFMGIVASMHLIFFVFVLNNGMQNPAHSQSAQRVSNTSGIQLDWQKELKTMSDYQKIDLLWQEIRKEKLQIELSQYLPTKKKKQMSGVGGKSSAHIRPAAYQNYLNTKNNWIDREKPLVQLRLLPAWRLWYWEENTGSQQNFNQYLPWDMRSRLNRKDLSAALIYGIRVCIVVGILSVTLSLAIGIPIGAISAYLGGQWDMLLMRLIEIWEAFPYFFMLLFIMSVMQTKSIFLVIAVIGFFGWSGFARFTRAEVLRQCKLPYVDACKVMGLSHLHILFRQILPNSLTPVMTLLPFAFMAAVGAEAGLAFLGLSEEGSCSWGTLMDEGRKSFPAESYLLWPPAILLTLLLVTIALLGDALRDANDPKLKP